MPHQYFDRPSSTKQLPRSSLLKIIKAAVNKNEYRYLRQIALGWLAFYPGDLEIKFYYAQALLGLGSNDNAFEVLEQITNVDPEYLPALQAKFTLTQTNNISAEFLEASLFILDMKNSCFPDNPLLPFFRKNYQWLINQNSLFANWGDNFLGLSTGIENTELFPPGIEKDITIPLLAVIYLRCLNALQVDPNAISSFAESYHTQWPDCVFFKLVLAQSYMRTDPVNGVALLNEAVALDTSAQVAERIWGQDFPFKKMWPFSMEIAPGHPTSPQSIPVPVSVSAYFGWNQLTTSDKHYSPAPEHNKTYNVSKDFSTAHQQDALDPSPNSPQPVHTPKKTKISHSYPILTELRQVAKSMNQPALSRIDGRYPIYVILSTKQGLEKKYGTNNTCLILEGMNLLAETISSYRQWGSLVYLADSPDFGPSHAKLKIEPTKPEDPWSIKLVLVDLDLELAKRGEMIGSILIVGGPEIVPFHHLPNPVDDTDPDVPSDNPYATRDENYFIPEWSVGRLPSDKGNNPELLLKQLNNSRTYHETYIQSQPWYIRIWEWLQNVTAGLPLPVSKHKKSYGYSAAVWRRASLSVFRPIGDPHQLVVSPPTQVKESCTLQNPEKSCLNLPKGRLAYFNLHGLADTDEWYGQRDPTEPGNDPDFPLALRAADIPSNGQVKSTPEIVFSEACFGANIIGKNNDEVIALKFLSNGCRVVVGSTCISYGSIGTPLIAADLLGHTFWHYLKEGQPAGEALRRARIRLVKEMNQRQGYLDGEDQKTLLSFVYYGDPLVQIKELSRGPKSTMRSNMNQQPIKIVCDRIHGEAEFSQVPRDVMDQVKEFVTKYLPSMTDAEYHVSYERANCSGMDHLCPTSQLNAKITPKQPLPKRKVVTLRKTIQAKTFKHPQFARMTMDESGKMVKLVVSR